MFTEFDTCIDSEEDVLSLLNRILEEKTFFKKDVLIRIFQNKVWVEKPEAGETVNEVLSDLANKLDSYLPSREWKNQDLPGICPLEGVIKSTLCSLNRTRETDTV